MNVLLMAYNQALYLARNAQDLEALSEQFWFQEREPDEKTRKCAQRILDIHRKRIAVSLTGRQADAVLREALGK